MLSVDRSAFVAIRRFDGFHCRLRHGSLLFLKSPETVVCVFITWDPKSTKSNSAVVDMVMKKSSVFVKNQVVEWNP